METSSIAAKQTPEINISCEIPHPSCKKIMQSSFTDSELNEICSECFNFSHGSVLCLGCHHPSALPDQNIPKIKNITVGDRIFPCPIDWTVAEVQDVIRSTYLIEGGGLRSNNVPVRGIDLVGSTTGVLTFVEGVHQRTGEPIENLDEDTAEAAEQQNVGDLESDNTRKQPNRLWVSGDQVVPSELYVRPAVTNLWLQLSKWFTSSKKRVAVVHGCPGTGKSTEVLGFSCSLLSSQCNSVVWIHFARQIGGSKVLCNVQHFVRKDKLMCTRFQGDLNSISIQRYLNFKVKCDLLVLDGHVDLTEAIEQCSRPPRILCCVSYSALPTKQSVLCAMASFVFPSWNKSDLRGAVEKECLMLPSGASFDYLYYVMGGCIRLWQQVCDGQDGLDSVKHSLKNLKFNVHHLKDLFTVGHQSTTSVNSLQSIRLDQEGNPICEPLSLFVSDLFLELTHFQSFSKYYIVAEGYRACIGWLFEIEMLKRANIEKQLVLYPDEQCTMIPETYETDAVTYFGRGVVDVPSVANVLLVPENKCQGCFDAVHLRTIPAANGSSQQYVLTFFNFTIAKSHAYNMEYVLQFLMRMFPTQRRLSIDLADSDTSSTAVACVQGCFKVRVYGVTSSVHGVQGSEGTINCTPGTLDALKLDYGVDLGL